MTIQHQRVLWNMSRGRRLIVGAIPVMVAFVAVPWLGRATFPVPLNLAGARCALLLLVGLIAVMVWVDRLDAGVPSIEMRRRRQLSRLRLSVLAGQIAVVALGAGIGAMLGASAPALTLATVMFVHLGLGGISAVLPRAVPLWILPVMTTLIVLVLGVDRVATVPHDWAVLLREGAPLRLTALVAMLLGAVCLTVSRRSRA